MEKERKANCITNGVVLLGDFELNIPFFSFDNSFTYVVGPNGAGKSSLLKTVLGLIDLKSGNRIVENEKGFGYVPQQYRSSLLPWLNASQNLFLHSSNPELLEKLLSTGFNESDLNKKPMLLSGGQCQRIALVREVCSGFGVVVLDEPFSGIDKKSITGLANIIMDVAAYGTKFVVTSHTDIPEEIQIMPGYEKKRIERLSDCRAIVNF